MPNIGGIVSFVPACLESVIDMRVAGKPVGKEILYIGAFV